MRFAVCDDQGTELKIVSKQLERYQTEHGCQRFTVDCYLSPKALIEALQAGVRYDVYILDMMMPEHNGVEVGRIIRAKNIRDAIIYITAAPEFALDAISIHPEQYLLKPIDPAALNRALDDIMVQHNTREAAFLSVKTRDGLERLPMEQIVCVEHAGRIMRVYLQNGAIRESISLRAPFEKLMQPLLNRMEFVQPHKSYFVNLNHVRALQADGMHMDLHMLVPVSRRNSAEIRRRCEAWAFPCDMESNTRKRPDSAQE